MADTSSLSTFLTDVADAIRAKKGSTALIPAASFDEEILNIPTSGGSGEVKLFATKEEMQADTTAKEGDLAIIYVNENVPLTSTMLFKTLVFPDTIILDSAITEQVDAYGNAQDETYVSFYVNSNNAHISISNWQTMLEYWVDYTTEDGITYVRSAESQSKISFATPLEVIWGQWNDIIGDFILSNQIVFNGLYQYKDSAYSLAPTQFTAIASNVFDANFYGKNGVEQGTLTTEVSNLFADVNAKLYMTLQDVYDEMEVTVLEDTDLTSVTKLYSKIPREIYVIPTKYDGSALIDTSNLTIASYTTSDNIRITLFSDCSNIRTIPMIDTSNVTDMSYMFNNCSNIKIIPLLNTNKVTNMHGMFYNCSNIKTIPLLDTSNVTDMSNAFDSCTSLTTIPLLDTSNVSLMENMFRDCTSLTAIHLLNTSNVTNMHAMFIGCTNLTTIPLLDTNNVTTMQAMFCRCSALTDVPELNTSNVTYMIEMFYGCTALKEVPSLDTSNVTDMTYMFRECSSLTSIPQLDTSNVTTISNMFNGCTSLVDIPVLNLTGINTFLGFVFPFNNCPALSDTSLNNIMESVSKATAYTGTKTLKWMGLTQEQATRCQSLSNYAAFTAAGWTTGY